MKPKVTAYFEFKSHTEEAGKFQTESKYIENLPRLEAEAQELGAVLTETLNN